MKTRVAIRFARFFRQRFQIGLPARSDLSFTQAHWAQEGSFPDRYEMVPGAGPFHRAIAAEISAPGNMPWAMRPFDGVGRGKSSSKDAPD